MNRAIDSGPYDPSLIPLGEEKENKSKRGRGWPIFKKLSFPEVAKLAAGLPGVLVPEPDDVAELVHDDAELVAVLADGDGLRSVAALANKRAAPGK